MARMGFGGMAESRFHEYTEAALRAMAHGGRLLIIGFPAGIPRIPMNLFAVLAVSLLDRAPGRLVNPQIRQDRPALPNDSDPGRRPRHHCRRPHPRRPPRALTKIHNAGPGAH